jgi:DNA-binding PadR family transcriptional regulator
MSSVRLFILDAFERHGEMHGHHLRLQAEEERVALWTDITVGALYGAIKRLAADGLITEVRVEREGNFPERQIYAITDAGRRALGTMRHQGLVDLALKPDPFDLAFTRLDPERLDELPRTIGVRLSSLERLLSDTVEMNSFARPWLTAAETFALSHREHRLRAEIDWHRQLIEQLPDIIADEKNRLAGT